MDIVNMLTGLWQSRHDPYAWLYIGLVVAGYLMKHPKVIYPLMAKFPRVAGLFRFAIGLVPDMNEALDGASLMVLGRVRKTKAAEQTIYVLDKNLKENK